MFVVKLKGQRAVPEEESLRYTIVYLFDERVYGELLFFGAYTSKVRYKLGGFLYESIVFNEDFEIVEEIVIPEIEEN